jgi:hypothetical protein
MADQDIRVTRPVEIESGSKAHVAFKLAQHIAFYEDDKKSKDRKYWLTLYRQCWKAADGHGLEAVLAEK